MRQLAVLALLLSGSLLPAADASLVNLLPANPRMVAGMNMQQSVNSPLGRFLLKQMKEDDAGLKKFIDATGFDPRRDLTELIVADYDGGAPAKGNMLMVAKGNFDAPRLRLNLLKDHTVSQMIGGFEVLSGKDGQGAVSFLDPSTAVAGDLAQVKAAIEKSGARLATDVQSRIAQMSSRYDAWIFTTTPVSSFANRLPEQKGNKGLNGGQLLQGILQANAGMKFGNSVVLDAELLARSEKDAQALVDVFKFITSMMQLNKENAEVKSEGLAALLEGMRVGVNGSTVNLNFSIPQTELERIFEAANASKASKSKSGVI